MIKNKKHINPSDYIKKYRKGGLIPLFQDGSETEMSPGMYDPNQNIYIANWDTDPNVQLYDESLDTEDTPNENITDDNIILDEGELQCQICDAGSPRNVPPVNGVCPEGSTVYDGKTNPCDAEEIEDTEEQTEGSEDTHITKTERGAPGWHTPDPYDVGPYGKPGDLYHLIGTIHGMGTDLGLWNPGFRGDDTTTTTTVPGEEQIEDKQKDELVCQKCDNGTPRNMPAVDGKCPEGFSPDNGINPCTGEKETTEETTTEEDDKKSKTFDEAFAEARAAGLETFEFDKDGDGVMETYNTKLKEEVNAENLDEDDLGMLQDGMQKIKSQSEIDMEKERNRILSGDDDWWNDVSLPLPANDMYYNDDDGDGIPNSIDKTNEYIWQRMYGGTTPYFQTGGTTSQAEYEQEQREKQAANMADTLQFQGPNTNFLAGMNANPNATDQPFIGPQLPQPPVDLDPDGDGINTGIDATPNFNQDLDPTDPSNIAPGTYDPEMNSYFRDTLNEAADTREDVDFYEPEEELVEDTETTDNNEEEGDIACQKCEGGYPVNVAPVDGQCPEGSTPDDGSDPCAGQPAPKDEEVDEGEEETKEEKKEGEDESKPFKPFKAAIKAAEFVNAFTRARNDRKAKRLASRKTSSDYVFGDSATAADNKGQYDVNTGIQQPDKQVYARQGKYGIELPKASIGLEYFKNNYPGFHDLTPEQQKALLKDYFKNSTHDIPGITHPTNTTDGYSQAYKDALAFKEQYRTHGYNPTIGGILGSNAKNWLRDPREGYGRIIIGEDMVDRMKWAIAGGKLDPLVAQEYANYIRGYGSGNRAIDYNIDEYDTYHSWSPEKQKKFKSYGSGHGYSDGLPGKGPFDLVSGNWSPQTLAAWIELADQMNQPKKYKDLDEEAIEAENKKRFNRQLNIDAYDYEKELDAEADAYFDEPLVYIPEDIEEEEDPFGPEGNVAIDELVMNNLNRPKEEIISLPTVNIDQIPIDTNYDLPSVTSSITQQETSKEDDSTSAYDFSKGNPYEYGTDEYYNWKKAKRSAMFADENEPVKKIDKKKNKRAEMFADAMTPQTQRRYGGEEEVDLDPATISKLIALGADIEIL